VDAKGLLRLPAELREADGITAGQEFIIEKVADGEYRLRRPDVPKRKLLNVLLDCPEKGFFAPMDRGTVDEFTAPPIR